MAAVGLRAATEADLPALVRLDKLGGRRSAAAWTSELARPTAWVTVAEVAGAVVGFTVSWDCGLFVELHDVVVAPEARRLGVGTALLRALAQRAQAAGAAAVELEVRRSNLGAQALYRGLGFVEVGLRRQYYPDGEDGLLFTWALGD